MVKYYQSDNEPNHVSSGIYTTKVEKMDGFYDGVANIRNELSSAGLNVKIAGDDANTTTYIKYETSSTNKNLFDLYEYHQYV